MHGDVLLLGPCPAEWSYYESTDSCFYVSTISLSLTLARAECLSLGGDLPSIANRAEWEYIISIS